jgi:glyoxylase-like metal-dependent hydrolase (beta-lactamase superfamily II)
LTFNEVAPGVFVHRHPVLDVNVGLILGDDAALVVDTLWEGAPLLHEIRSITDLPLHVVNTHHHFDHCYGNSAFAAFPIWAHTEAAALMHRPQTWPGLTLPALHLPDRLVRTLSTVDLGGRQVHLRWAGPAHTAGDLVVLTDDACFTGDLIEEGGDPQFDDAYPLDWPEAVATLLPSLKGVIIPGHGATVDRAFVEHQHTLLAALAWLIREADADGAPEIESTIFAPETIRTATRRGFDHLSGKAL